MSAKTGSESHGKIIFLSAYLLFLIILFFSFFNTSFSFNANTLTIFSSNAVLILIIAAVTFLFRFYSDRVKRDFILGIGLIGLSLLEFSYTIIISGVLNTFLRHTINLVYWSWWSGQLYFAVIIFISFKNNSETISRFKIKSFKAPYFIIFILCTILISVLFIYPLPEFSKLLIWVPGIIFLINILNIFRQKKWPENIFEFWLLVSVITALCHIVFVSFSATLFDIKFFIAQILKGFSFAALLFGLVIHLYYRLTKFEFQKQQLFRETIDRKYAERAMRKYRSYNDLILSSSAEGILGLDLEGKHTFANPAAERILGYSSKELIGKASHETWHRKKADGSDFPEDDCPLLQFFSYSKNIYEAEDIFWKKEDRFIHVKYTASPLIREKETIGAVVLFSDISKHKMAEDELRKKSHVIEQSPLSIVITDLKGNIEYVNPGFSANTGYTFKEVIGKNPRILNAGIRGVTDFKNMWDTLLKGKTWNGEFLNRKKDGSLVWEKAIVSPIKDSEGKNTHFSAIKSDITEQKNLLKNLYEKQQNLEKTQKIAQLVSWELNLEKDQFTFSRNFAKSNTINNFSTLKQAVLAVTDEQDHFFLVDLIKRVFAGKTIGSFEFRIKEESGKYRWYRSLPVEVKTYAENEKPLIMMGAFQDITESKNIELQLKEYNEALQRSNSELQDFTFIASHDLQEPLRKISTFGERLEKQAHKLDPKSIDYLHRLLRSSKRMRILLNDLLAYSRITTVANNYGEIDLTDIVNLVIDFFEPQINEYNAQIRFKNLHTITGDSNRIRILLQNIIGNALKYRKENGVPEIIISSKMVSKERAFCEIIIQDNGIGFDKKYINKIFIPFQRLHSRSEYEGTGIGLAICKKIVENHGGTITADSKPGKGATFIIRLPQ